MSKLTLLISHGAFLCYEINRNTFSKISCLTKSIHLHPHTMFSMSFYCRMHMLKMCCHGTRLGCGSAQFLLISLCSVYPVHQCFSRYLWWQHMQRRIQDLYIRGGTRAKILRPRPQILTTPLKLTLNASWHVVNRLGSAIYELKKHQVSQVCR